MPPVMLQPGTRIGEYQLGELLGEGGMGRVYAATERLSGREVALKLVRAESAGGERLRARFLSEMAILTRLDHPHIVRCLACLEHEGQPVMVMERLRGRTLRQRLASFASPDIAWGSRVIAKVAGRTSAVRARPHAISSLVLLL
jgi:serine/threonine-protein kinase